MNSAQVLAHFSYYSTKFITILPRCGHDQQRARPQEPPVTKFLHREESIGSLKLPVIQALNLHRLANALELQFAKVMLVLLHLNILRKLYYFFGSSMLDGMLVSNVRKILLVPTYAQIRHAAIQGFVRRHDRRSR